MGETVRAVPSNCQSASGGIPYGNPMTFQAYKNRRGGGDGVVDTNGKLMVSRFVQWGGVALATWVLSTPSLQGQLTEGPQFGLGYVANAPDQMVGGSAYAIWPVLGGLGIYVDAKFDIEGPRNDIAFRDDLTAAEVRASPDFTGARFLKDDFSHRNVNVALVRPINPGVFIYAGGGLSWGENYKLYEQIIAEVGRALWVADPEFDETTTNLLGGLILRISSVLSSQIGYETNPKGFTAGVSLRLPRW